MTGTVAGFHLRAEAEIRRIEGNGMPNETTGNVNRLVQRNISALLERRSAEEAELTWQEKLADGISGLAGRMTFVWAHAAAYGLWVVVNLGWIPGIAPFDPTFVVLAMLASVEAIFLSTFILITQNRMQAQADRRADLNLQISLLAEHEITRLVKMTVEIGERMDIPSARAAELDELKQDVRPEGVLESLDQGEEHKGTSSDAPSRKPRHSDQAP